MFFRLSLILLGILVAETSAASSCMKMDWTIEEHIIDSYRIAPVIFKGKTRSSYGHWVDVDAVWKGMVPPLVYVDKGTQRLDSRVVVFFGNGPNEKGMYTSFGTGMSCFSLPDYNATLDILNKVYGPGRPPREDNFAVSWFVSLVLMLLVGACLWVSKVVIKGEI